MDNLIKIENLQSKIYTIRDTQVMLDSDLAHLYGVETRVFNQAVKRNIKRFPENFRFQLTQEEYESILRSQIVILNETSNQNRRGKHRKYLPYVFTEQGISMLSTVLKSDIAIEVSIKIIEAFVSMRKFLINNASIFQRLDSIETKLLKHDENFNKIFNALEDKTIQPKQGIFYDGQIFDAYEFVAKLIKSAKNSIKLIDNYIDESVLTLFSKNQNVDVTIYTKKITRALRLDLDRYNAQYKPITIREFNSSHDRFLIIDDKEVYHIGASLKDLGKKWFAFSKMSSESLSILEKLQY